MDTAMPDDSLIAFLTARLDEREAAARAATTDFGLPAAWGVDPAQYGTGLHEAQWKHIALNDPARVLREVEAKRAIVARYAAPRDKRNLGEHLQWSQEQAGLLFALSILAAVYSDHPDYREEWRLD